MTQTEAIEAIGQRFKVKDFTGMPDDVIRQVTTDGVIIGDWVEALAEDCRFIQALPEGLAKWRADNKHLFKIGWEKLEK